MRRRIVLCLLSLAGLAPLAVAAQPAAPLAAPFLGEPGVTYAVPVRSLKQVKLERAFRTTVRQQHDFSCGSAALATLLTYHYGRPVNEAQAFQAMYAAGDRAKIQREGFSLLDIKRFLEANGYRADGVQVSLDEIAKVGVPAIALVQENGYNHFVVVKGVQGNRVVIGDPALGTRIVTSEHFASTWKGGIFFVIRSHREIAAFNARADWESRLTAALEQGVFRESLGSFGLTIPTPDYF